VVFWSVCKERGKKRKEKNKKWGVWLKSVWILKSSKFGPSGGDDWLTSDF
jgi:hypothetical protein